MLSEAPPAHVVADLANSLGKGWPYAPGWTYAIAEHGEPAAPYFSRVAVCSPWPMRRGPDLAVANGAAAQFVFSVNGRDVRLLVVDGRSDLWSDRRALLKDVADLCDHAADAGEAIDLIAGDFNAPGRAISFDRIADRFALASRSSHEWRGTFPSLLPLYDIDHVWVRAGWPILACDLFTSRHSDHRGQFVRFAIPDQQPNAMRP